MKLLSYFSIFFFLFFINACVSPNSLTSSSVSEPSSSNLEEKLLSKNFTFEAYRAFPTGLPMVDLSGNSYTVIYEEDVIKSFLPFYGTRTGGPSFGKSQAMNFEAKPEAFVIEDTKNGFEVDTKVRTSEDTYSLSLYVRKSGEATLTITSKTRSTISYEGEIR